MDIFDETLSSLIKRWESVLIYSRSISDTRYMLTGDRTWFSCITGPSTSIQNVWIIFNGCECQSQWIYSTFWTCRYGSLKSFVSQNHQKRRFGASGCRIFWSSILVKFNAEKQLITLMASCHLSKVTSVSLWFEDTADLSEAANLWRYLDLIERINFRKHQDECSACFWSSCTVANAGDALSARYSCRSSGWEGFEAILKDIVMYISPYESDSNKPRGVYKASCSSTFEKKDICFI